MKWAWLALCLWPTARHRRPHQALLAELERDRREPDIADRSRQPGDGRHTRVAVGYNVQVAVDAKHKLIVEQEVTNQVVDMGLLKRPPNRPARSLVSSGSMSSPIAATSRSRTSRPAKRRGSTPHVPKPQRGPAVRNGFFRKDEFRYDPERDVFTCPAGQHPATAPSWQGRGVCKRSTTATGGLPRLSAASAMHANIRRVSRLENEAVFDRMAARLRGQARAARPAPRDRRASLRLDQAMDEPGCLPDAGLDNVRGEFSLTALAYNLRRALNILGVGTLIAGSQGWRRLVIPVATTRGVSRRRACLD